MPDTMREARRWYAQDLKLRAPVRRHMAIVEAFASVPRERFLGPGPWRLVPERWSDSAFVTPDDDPRWLYHDTLVSIDLRRGLNNGLPSLWARSFDHLDWKRGRRVMQVGAGTGYYTAVLAEIVGPTGRVIAVECDAGLAAKARDNIRPWTQAEVVEGDGRTHDPGDVDTVVVFAGSTHPAPLWLDRLTAGGQLLMPLTAENWLGFLLRVTRNRHYDANLIVLPSGRDPTRFDAASIGPVGIFPCSGGRDLQAAQRLQHMFDEHLRAPRCSEIPIRALHRGEAGQGDMDKVSYQGQGFWLERITEDCDAGSTVACSSIS